MSPQQNQLVIQAVLMVVWQRLGRTPVILHSDRGGPFTSEEYQRFLEAHQVIYSMSAVGLRGERGSQELLRRAQTRTGEPTPLPDESRGESGYL